jgi:hypothetical protein
MAVAVILIALLLAVVGAFVFGGSSAESMPEATLEARERPDTGPHGYLNVSISAGPTIDTAELEAAGDDGLPDSGVSIKNTDSYLRGGDLIVIRFSERAQPGETVLIRWSANGSDQTGRFFEHTLSSDWAEGDRQSN